MVAKLCRGLLCLSFLLMASSPGWAQCPANPLSPQFTTVAAAGEPLNGGVNATFTVAKGCTYTGVSNPGWIHVWSGNLSNGNNVSQVAYSVDANTGGARQGSIMLTGGNTSASFQVNQDNGCTYSLASTSQSATAAGGSFSIGITSGSGCTWAASSSAGWITVPSSGTGNVSYSVAANNTYSTRSGTITVSGSVFTVTQEALPCTYSLSPSSQPIPAKVALSASALRPDAHGRLRLARRGSRCPHPPAARATGQSVIPWRPTPLTPPAPVPSRSAARRSR